MACPYVRAYRAISVRARHGVPEGTPWYAHTNLMPYDPNKHHRRSIRVKGYDYSKPGWYYVTVCTNDRKFLFGEVVREQMRTSKLGDIAGECWNEIPKHFPRAALDVSIVMPNHLHGIIILSEDLLAVQARHGVPRREPRPGVFAQPVAGSLGVIVAQFKQAVTRRANLPERIWHRNYYEHIISNDRELDRIREYICTNPLRWRYDVENPEFKGEAADDIEELLDAEDDEL